MMTAMIPTIVGLNEATNGARDHEDKRRGNARKQRCHLQVTCAVNAGPQELRQQVHNAMVYLGTDGKVWLYLRERSFLAFRFVFFLDSTGRYAGMWSAITDAITRYRCISPRNQVRT